MATKTANGNYPYNMIYHGKSLREWVELVHTGMAKHYNWENSTIHAGAFGFDNMAVSIGLALNSIDSSMLNSIDPPTEKNLAVCVHKGWIENYVYWRDHKPWLGDINYKKPFNPLGDERRDKCANTEYDDLPEDEKEKDLVIARVIAGCLN